MGSGVGRACPVSCPHSRLVATNCSPIHSLTRQVPRPVRDRVLPPSQLGVSAGTLRRVVSFRRSAILARAVFVYPSSNWWYGPLTRACRTPRTHDKSLRRAECRRTAPQRGHTPPMSGFAAYRPSARHARYVLPSQRASRSTGATGPASASVIIVSRSVPFFRRHRKGPRAAYPRQVHCAGD
jgi:hypothetical protein